MNPTCVYSILGKSLSNRVVSFFCLLVCIWHLWIPKPLLTFSLMALSLSLEEAGRGGADVKNKERGLTPSYYYVFHPTLLPVVT